MSTKFVNRPTLVIAEAGVNHNGSLDMAKRLIDIASSAGADAVKFQTFRASALAGRDAPKADYQIGRTGASESQYRMLERLELDEAAHTELIERCMAQDIEFLSTPFEPESLDMLVNQFGLARIKLSSGDITNAPLLLRAARHAKPLILSTGMATLEEVGAALDVLAFGYTQVGDHPATEQFLEAGRSSEGRAALRDRVTLLHCTTEYPAPFADVNLRAMETMRTAFGLEVGYSDHTAGISVAVAAAALGATVIEKHFTLDRTLPGPDHQASLEPDELRRMVQSIREVEAALGGPLKAPAPSELKNRAAVRKSLVATRGIRRGEAFREGNLGVKRPGSGVSPFRYWEYLGKVAGRDYSPDEVID